jgi:broad specificity phosphatase PhoE
MQSLLVIQHCQSEHHVNELTGGWTDTPLTALGRRQAACIAERLRRELGRDPCPLYSSDLKRAWQTAEIVGAALGTAPSPAPDLREWNGGAATGKTQAWADEHVKRENPTLFDTALFEGAETWRQFHGRTCGAMEALAASDHDAAIVVTHGGTTSNIVTWWLRLELDSLPERTPFAGAPGGISSLRINRFGNPVVERLNDRTHLHAASLGGGREL